MLRKIQLAAALTAWFFGIVALGDVLAIRAGLLQVALYNAALWSWFHVPVAPSLAGSLLMGLAAGMAFTSFTAVLSVWEGLRAWHVGAAARLDFWRRFTWGASVIETGGCLLFVMNGIVLFVPSAVALLIVGVAELATILQDMERQPEPVVRRLARHERTHLL